MLCARFLSEQYMPELPEVETTIGFLNKRIINRRIKDVWTDSAKIIKKPADFKIFKREIKNKKIERIWRKGKNIIFNLSEGKILLIHQKLTGHLLVGYWIMDNGYWKPKSRGFLGEKVNTYIHLLFTLDNGLMLGLSDLRKFAKVLLVSKDEFENLKDLRELGPEPLDKTFSFEKFKERFENKKAAKGEPRQRRGKIKQVLMDQTVIAGIGNIYSDEILWEAKIHPLENVKMLDNGKLRKIYKAMQKILKKGIELRGESFSDYRMPNGEKGGFDKYRKVYRRKGEKCSRCGALIEKIKTGGRSAHFCPLCQKL